VAQVLLKVKLGEGDGAFVYQTDVWNAKSSLTVIELPAAYQVTSEFYLALLKEREIKEEARHFYDFILSDTGQEVLAQHGFY